MSASASDNSGDNHVTGHDDGQEGGDGYEEFTPPADRFLTAQMWWIASELVRRHPHLRIAAVEVNEGDRLLIVHDEQDGLSIQWDLVGGCKYLINGEVHAISWIEMMAALSPHETLKRIEVATGLGVPKAVPATTPRALAYRVIASAFATAVDDRHEWYAVPAPMLNGTCDYFDNFPTAIDARTAYEDAADEQLQNGREIYFFQPFWAVLRDLQPIAIFDVAGVAHTAAGAMPLMPLYTEIHHNLTITTARVLGPYLP